MNLTDQARLQGTHLQAAYWWFREETFPVPAVRVNSRPVLVVPDAVIAPAQGGTGLHAGVSARDWRAGRDRQVGRLSALAAPAPVRGRWWLAAVALSADGRGLVVPGPGEVDG